MEDTYARLINCRFHLFRSPASSFNSQYLLPFLKSLSTRVLLIPTRLPLDPTLSFPYFLPSPFLTCCAILPTSFRGKGPIWGGDWSHSPFIRRSPSWGILEFSSAVSQMPGDPCTAPRIISLSPLSLATDVTLGSSGLWLGTRTRAGGTDTLTEGCFFFGRSPWLHGQQVFLLLLTPSSVLQWHILRIWPI